MRRQQPRQSDVSDRTGNDTSAAGTVAPPAPAPAAPDEVFVGARGDIARCGVGDAEATAKLLDRIPGTVFTLGDNA